MSLVGALDTAVSGLKVAQLQVQNAANNIANASDPNFSRKEAQQAPINLGANGGGVQIIGYNRTINTALNRIYIDAITSNGFNTAASDVFASIKDIYGLSTDTAQLSTRLSSFITAWQSYSAAPESIVRQREIISAGDSFAQEIRRISAALDTLDTDTQKIQTDAIEEVNGLLSRIDNLNDQIASATASGEPSGNLEDSRDAALRDLAKYMNIRSLEGDLGRVRIITPAGFMLLDSTPVTLTFDGTDYETVEGVNLNNVLTGGSLQSLQQLREDGSPAAANTDPGREVIRKLRSQLDELADSFLTTVGSPTTFAAAYDGATTATGELASSFFTGTGRTDIAINAALLNGTSNVKRASADVVVAALNNNGRSYTADGLTVSDTSYSNYVASMLGVIGAAAATVEGRADLTQAAEETYKERFANTIGVNVDEELVALTRYQNSYTAVARVISVVNEMFDILDSISR